MDHVLAWIIGDVVNYLEVARWPRWEGWVSGQNGFGLKGSILSACQNSSVWVDLQTIFVHFSYSFIDFDCVSS